MFKTVLMSLIVLFLIAACESGDRYIAKREYLVVERDDPARGTVPSMRLIVQKPSIQGIPSPNVFNNDCGIFPFNLDKCEYREPAWSPDGSRFAVVAKPSNADSSAFKIYITDWNGSSGSGSFALNGGNVFNPAWSPDGRHIVFNSNNDIWLRDTCFPNDSSVQVTTDAENNSDPTWSRDGNWIAYVSTRSGNRDIWAKGVSSTTLATGRQSFTFGARANWTDNGAEEDLPYFSKIGPTLNGSNGINKLLFQRDNDIFSLPVPPGSSTATQITNDGTKIRYAEFILHNTIVAFIKAGDDKIFEIAISTGNTQSAQGVESFGSFSSRQEWNGEDPLKICP